MRHLIALLCLLTSLSLLPAAAQEPPVSQAQLDAISQRGRALAAYDEAAWHATDVAKAAVNGDSTGLKYFIARKTDNGWAVDFGMLDSAGTTFLTRIEAVGADTAHFTAKVFSPPRSDTGFLVAAAHAIATAEANFDFVRGYPYNVAVIPKSDGTMYVYLYPAQIDANSLPLGGDARFTISADGMRILDAHRMHKSILARSPAAGAPAGARLVAGFNNEVLENVPEDTDVFHVLAQKPPIPEYVSARGELYFINADGSIEYKGRAGAKPWETASPQA